MAETVIRPTSVGGLEITTVAEGSQYLNMLIYGHSGVGKTRLAASAAAVEELSPVLFIDIEGGTMSIRDVYPDVDRVRVKSMMDMQNTYQAIRDGKLEYKTIVLDSLTEIQKFSMLQIMKELLQEEPERDPEVPGLREWGKNAEQTRRLIRAFRDLPVNTIFTALAAEERDKYNKSHLKPSLNGKLSSEAQGFLDIVVYMYIKEVDGEQVRLLLTSSTESVQAKDRSDRLPPVVENPTMETIHGIVFDQGKE